MMVASIAVLLLCAIHWTDGRDQRQVLPLRDYFERGDAITLQGCVERAVERNALLLTKVQTWPMVTTPEGIYGLRHFWVRSPGRFRNSVGNTVQVTGHVASVKASEIELEPGWRKFGRFVEIERPDRPFLVTPGSIGLTLDSDSERSDIPVTMIEIKIDEVLELMRGCLPFP